MLMTSAHNSGIVSLTSKRRGSMVMKGGIYRRDGATGPRWVVRYPGKIWRRFRSYEDAETFLIALNFKSQEGTLDPRDYRADAPLGMETLARKWLEYRVDSGVRDTRHAKAHMGRAVAFFGNANIKAIGAGELEDFFACLRRSTDLSGKSLHNIRTTLHTFWGWVARRERIEIPVFPEIRFTLGWRKIVDKDTQARIIEEVRSITRDVNPRIYIGILWLATYPSVRPLELIHVREQDVDLANGLITITHNKVPTQYKRLYLLPEDVDLVRALPRGLPGAYLFRHDARPGLPASQRGRFGRDYFYRWWRRACGNLGVQGVDLYGGTRHSTVTALGEHFSPEEIMGNGSGHTTNKAFARYFQIHADQRRAISAHARPAHHLHMEFVRVGIRKRLKKG